MKEMDYYQPRTPRETLRLLDRFREKAAILAGGTELVVDMKTGKRKPEVLINIKHIDSFKQLQYLQRKVVFGPLVTLSEIEDSTVLREKIPVLSKAASLIGSRQIRNIATIGGNIANASPCADMVPPLIALDAHAKIHTLKGIRRIAVGDFFLGPGHTVAGHTGLLGLIEVRVPAMKTRISHQFITLRRAMDVTIASVVVRVDIVSKKVTQARVVMGAVAPTPLRSVQGESLLVNRKSAEVDVGAVSDAAANECRPICDVRASDEYRREMVRVLTRKALEEVLS